MAYGRRPINLEMNGLKNSRQRIQEFERMADFMRRCKGKVMVSINDHPDIRQAFDGFHMEQLSIKYSVGNQRQGGPATSSELVIMNWQPEVMSGLF